MIKYSTRRLKHSTHYDCTAKAIKTHEQPPPNWRDTTIKFLHKSGDVASLTNCRPICSIPKTLEPTLFHAATTHAGRQPVRWPSRFQTRPLFHVPATPTESHRVGPAVRCGSQHWLMEANICTSSGEPGRETRSARSCSAHSCNTSWDQ